MDGMLLDSNGKQVEFTILTNSENLSRQAIAVIVQDDLKNCMGSR